MKKLLTIVICCYNSSSTITKTLKSIDVKNNNDIDVFIIDDGSTDNLQKTVKPFTDKFPNNFHYFRKQNGNWGSCVNLAIDKAKSKFLSIIDSDDFYDKDGFNYVLKELRLLNEKTDITICNYVWNFLHKKKHNLKQINISRSNKNHENISINDLNLFHVITIHSTIFNVNLLKKMKPLPEKAYYTDGVLIYESLLSAKNICYINRKVHWYNYCIRRGSDQSISAEKTVKNYKNLEIVFDAFLNVPFPQNPTIKQINIAKKFICNHFYWLYFALAKNYNFSRKQKINLLKQYYEKLVNFEKTNNVKISTKTVKFFNCFKKPLLPIINFVTQYLPISFLKASRYTRSQKKKAKLEAKKIKIN